ncbi:hypothetical protein N7478_006327 [Penicillium angulare]|uniref:uncharacterized protein n=1 Tax=Penicillium angulare TaxID=116970 RepID=UPI00253F6652|nr:uncharacterized protein N7478_006327 [Penicillium angulare]KAJ5280955.1 hypothetical protein N7478_006327 [Penicillium angulare]
MAPARVIAESPPGVSLDYDWTAHELRLNPPQDTQSSSIKADIINGTQPPISPFSSDVFGPLNFSIASRSSSSHHSTTPTIDFQSFTTDQFQQSWLPSPPPPQPSAPSLNNNSNNNNNSALEDFVLYPQPRPQPRPRDSRLLAPPSTALKPSALKPFLAQNTPRRQTFSLQLQRHLQQQFSGSPVQDPRVTKLARSPSYWSHPTVKHSQLNSATVPTNSPQRPPVPLFHTDNIEKKYMQTYRRNMSAPNFQGNTQRYPAFSSHPANPRPPEHDSELFGLPSAGAMAPMTFDDLLGQETGEALSPEALTGTISPKDLMFESIPPSGTFTDLSTPPFDSPGTFSQNPSPLFTDVDFMGHDEWPPLFHDGLAVNTAASGLFDTDASDFNVAALSEPKKEVHASIEMSPAPKRLSLKSSPISATGTTKHSSISGISRQRKDLSPVEFDPSDPIAAKRARNTEAARKSRAKKLARQTTAESRIKVLEDKLAQRDELIANLQAQLELHKSFQ